MCTTQTCINLFLYSSRVCVCVCSNTCRSFIRNNRSSFICSFSSSNTPASRLKR